MLTRIEIENFKSIYKESIELGRVNVFIGENGCGKTNILEAVGMASARFQNKISNDELALKGIRVSKPSITISSFKGLKQKKHFYIKCHFKAKYDDFNLILPFKMSPKSPDDIYSQWNDYAKSDYSEVNFAEVNKIIAKEVEQLVNEIKLQKSNSSSQPAEPYIRQALLLRMTGYLPDFKMYTLSTEVLRGIGGRSFDIPGIHGENLDVLIASLAKEEFSQLIDHSHFISWLEEIVIDKEGTLRLQGHNLNLSQSKLYFRDKFMAKKNNIFSAENANEGILHILFYLALFISKRTPKFFAIDNIETALNPQLCRALMVELVKLAKKNDKQVLITTHNPAILDGLNLHDDEVRLFIVERDFKGHTRVERLKIKPDAEVDGQRLKLSELWMRGYLGAIPQHF
ncbi:MAG: AAA family ATPase [Lewinellaceae bacterium]|nr:AAA family ATPase [Saprospiraceae bacterium]MCB9339227.1 AAA family ATPase [Lewinellaceae bacterium]